MAITAKIEGMEEISEMLTKLGEDAEKIAAKGLYQGAGIMAAEVNKGANSIRTETFRYAAPGRKRDPSPEEKNAVLAAGAGIAKFDKNGSEVNTSVGYSGTGYADTGYGRKPIAQIANAINSGTSFMRKQPFIRKAASAGAQKATEAIRSSIEEQFDAITK